MARWLNLWFTGCRMEVFDGQEGRVTDGRTVDTDRAAVAGTDGVAVRRPQAHCQSSLFRGDSVGASQRRSLEGLA